MSDRFVAVVEKMWNKLERKQWIYGSLGRKNTDDSYTIEVAGRRNFVYVTLRLATGGQTTVPARNDAGVQHAPKLSVRMKLEYGIYVIHGRTGTQQGGSNNPPDNPDGVPVHTHDHSTLTDLTSDDHLQYFNQERGDDTYFNKDEFIDISVGAADAGKPIVLNVDGEIDDTMLPLLADTITAAVTDNSVLDADLFPYVTAGVLVNTAWLNIKTLIGTYIASAALTFTNKTLDSTNISTLTAKGTPIDADSVVLVDSAAANVFKRTTGTDIKAFLKTYFDTLYVALTGTQTIAGNKTFTGQVEITNANNAPLAVERTTSATTGAIASQTLRATSSGNMTDDFGPLLTYQIEDDAGVENVIAHWGALRDGADNSGLLIGYLRNAGVLVEVLRIEGAASDGLMILGGLASVGASRFGIKAGTSTNDAAVGGILFVSTTSVGNVGTGVDDLMTYSVPANTLAVNHQSLRIRAWGTFAENGNTKSVRLMFGSSVIAQFQTMSSLIKKWRMEAIIVRTGATTQIAELSGHLIDVLQVVEPFAITATANQTLSGAVILKMTGEGTSNNDITQEYFKVEWLDANT